MTITTIDIDTSSEELTAALRWGKNGKLQQGWRRIDYKGRQAVSVRTDWRDVPTEDDVRADNEQVAESDV